MAIITSKSGKDWDATHPRPEGITFVTEIPSYSLIITDEGIKKLINQSDANVKSTLNLKS